MTHFLFSAPGQKTVSGIQPETVFCCRKLQDPKRMGGIHTARVRKIQLTVLRQYH